MIVATRERGDAHHERVQRVLRPHEAGVEQAQADRHEQDERRRDEHPGGVARVDLAGGGEQRAHFATGVTARSSVSPVRMRTTRSSGTTKILPSPTSPVWAPSQSASSVGLHELVGDGDLEADLLGEAHLHARAAVRLDAVELAAVALHAAQRDPAHLGAVERLEHVVDLVRPDDADDELHARAAGRSVAARRRRLVMRDPLSMRPCRLAVAGARGLCPRGQRSAGVYGPAVQRSRRLDRLDGSSRAPAVDARDARGRRLDATMRIVVLGAGICGLVGGLLLARDGHEVTLVERDPAPVPDGADRPGTTGRATASCSFTRRTTCSRAGARSSSRSCRTSSTRWPRRGRLRFDVLSVMPPSITDRGPRPGDERFVTLTARRPVLEQVLGRAAERAGGAGRAPRRRGRAGW